jgi:hypothetical protein
MTMRFLAFLNRRYPPAQFLVLLLPAVAVVLAAPIALIALGVSEPLTAPISLVAALGTFFIAAALVDRRSRI